MNKTLLLIAAAAGAYALLRPKTNTPVVSAAPALTTGAASWPTAATATPAPATPPASAPSWVTSIAHGIETGVDIFNTIKGALPHSASSIAPVKASPTADAGF